MIASGDYSIVVGYSQLGARKFLGSDDRWNLIMTRIGSEAKRIKDTLNALLSKYWNLNENTTTEKLQEIVNQFITTATRDWRYYFAKYPTFVDNKALYAWKNDFELRKLNGDSLLYYHINPFVRAVVLGIKNKSICDYNDCVGLYGDLSSLKLKNGVEMEHLEKRWRCKIPDKVDASINKQLLSIIPIENRANEYWLLETETLDRVEGAIQFAKNFQ